MAGAQGNRRIAARQSAAEPAPPPAFAFGCGGSPSPSELGEDREVSRRAVLGAAAALPFLPRHPGLDPGSILLPPGAAEGPFHPPRAGEEWQHLLAGYRAAEGAVEVAGRVCEGALRRGSGQAVRAEVFAAEEVYGDRLEELYEVLRRLLRAPAPDLGALGIKIELMVEHKVGTLWRGAPCLAAIREDARRLVGTVN